MNRVKRIISGWKQDNLLRRIIRNSSYLFIGNTLSTIIQSILSARLLGILGFGILGVVVEFATNINRLLSFRMGELVVKYVGQYLVENRKDRAAAILKASILLETITSIFAYLLLVLLAPLAARLIVKDISTAPLISFYALALLANFATESSTGFLQVTDRFRSQAIIGTVQSLLTAGLIIYAFIVQGSIELVLGAYLAGKAFNGLTLAGYAISRAFKTLGPHWWKQSFTHLPPAREFWQFAWSTNLSGTITMVTRDSESVWLSMLLGPLAAGIYKTAKAIINLVTLPITPFITAAYPAINNAVAQRTWSGLKDLLKKLTLIAATWTGAVSFGLLILGRWLIITFYGPDYAPSYPVLLILLIGFGFANIFYWNRNLLLSLGQPAFPLKIITITGILKLILTLVLVPRFGYMMEAVLLSSYFIVSIGLIVIQGIRQIQKQSNEESAEKDNSTDEIEQTESTRTMFKTGLNHKIQALTSVVNSLRKKLTFRRLNRWDWLIFLIFIGFTGIYFLGRLQGNFPTVILTGDAGNIASYAAAMDHPDWFTLDPVLGNPANIGVYKVIQIPFIRFLVRALGDYALASIILVIPQTFLHLLGFYILGRVMFHNRFWAFCLAFLTAMTVINFGLGEIWGIWQDALPRVTFQALLPFLLALSIHWRNSPRKWPWLILLSGLLVFVHPISAPAWGLALWLGMWLMHPKGWKLRKRILVMTGLGILFLIVLLPYALSYLTYRGQDPVVDVGFIRSILELYSPENIFDIPSAFLEFSFTFTRNLLIPFAIIGYIVTWVSTKDRSLPIKVVSFWMLGVVIMSIILPLTERFVERQLNILPLETELIRCIRYFIPLLLIFWLWPFAEVIPRLKNRIARSILYLTGTLFVLFWGVTHPPAVGDMLDAVSCLSKGNIVCSSTRSLDELLGNLRTESSPGQGVFFYNQDLSATSRSLSVRYIALRPLVYSYRDSGILGYSNRSKLPSWFQTTNQVTEIRAEADPDKRLMKIIPLAQELSAEFLIIDFQVPQDVLTDLPVSVVLQNTDYILLRLH